MTGVSDVINGFLELFEETQQEPVMNLPSTGSTTSIPLKDQKLIDKAKLEETRQLIDNDITILISYIQKVRPFNNSGTRYAYNIDGTFKIPDQINVPNLKNYLNDLELQRKIPVKKLANKEFVEKLFLLIGFAKQSISEDVPVKTIITSLKWDEKFIDRIFKVCFTGKKYKTLIQKASDQKLKEKVNKDVEKLLKDIQKIDLSPEKLPEGNDYEYIFHILTPENFPRLLSKKYPNLGEMVELSIKGTNVKGNEYVDILSSLPFILSNPPVLVQKLKKHKEEAFFDGLFKILDPNTQKELTLHAKQNKEIQSKKLVIDTELKKIDEQINDPSFKSYSKSIVKDKTGYTYDIPNMSEFCNNYKNLKLYLEQNIKNPDQPFKPNFENIELFEKIKLLFEKIQVIKDRTKLSKLLLINENILDNLVITCFPSSEKVSNQILKNTKELETLQYYLENNPETVNHELVETLAMKTFLNSAKFFGKDLHNKRDEFSIFSADYFLDRFPFRKTVQTVDQMNSVELEVVKSMALVKKPTPEDVFKSKDEFMSMLDSFFKEVAEMSFNTKSTNLNVFDVSGKISFLSDETKISFKSDDFINRIKFLRLISTIRHLVRIRKDTYQIKIPTDEIKRLAGSDSATYGTVSLHTRKTSADSLRVFFNLMGYPVPLVGENFRDYLYQNLPSRLAKIWSDFWNDWTTNQFETHLKR